MIDTGVHDAQRLRELQALPLWRKIQITQTRILEWYHHYDGAVYVSLSGGKDSTVLLDLARRAFPDIKAMFVNTGLEYPEIRKFALSFDNVDETHPVWGRAAKKHGKKPKDVITFKDVVTNYGYPIISKTVSNAIGESRRTPNGSRWVRLHGGYKRKDGRKSMYDHSRYLPLYYLPVRISDTCCKVSKKGPAHEYQHSTGLHPIVATMTDESLIRRQAWITTGCNAFSSKEPISKPMSFWTEQDVLHYISDYGVKICSVYGEVVTEDCDGFEYSTILNPQAPLHCTGCQRTGCIFCAYGCHLEKGETRFQRLKRTHPKLYTHCIEGGDMEQKPGLQPERNGSRQVEPAGNMDPVERGARHGPSVRHGERDIRPRLYPVQMRRRWSTCNS